MLLWPLPCKFCQVWASISKVINEISVKFAWVFQYIYSFRRQFRRQFSTVFHVIFQAPSAGKWNESGFRPPLCTYRLNWARRTSWGWWDDWDDTVLQTQDSKFEPWRSEAEHATSRSRRLPTILTFTRGWGRNIFVSFKPPRPGTEPRTLAWKAAVLTTTLGPPPSIGWNYGNCPVNLAEFDWVLQKLIMQSSEPTLWRRRRTVFRWYLSQFPTVLHVILHTPFAAIAATALKIWWGLIEYSKSY